MDDATSRRVEVGFSSNVDLSDATSSRRFSGWEEQCILDTEVESTSEALYLNEQRNLDQKLWLAFQNTASAIAQLYKDRAQGKDDLWGSFQNAAEIATSMYKVLANQVYSTPWGVQGFSTGVPGQTVLNIANALGKATLEARKDFFRDQMRNGLQQTTLVNIEVYMFLSKVERVYHFQKESVDGYRRVSELALQCGYQRRNKEMMSWTKKRRKHIRREDLLGYLCGRSPPHRGPRPCTSHNRSPSMANSSASSNNQLQTFQEAVLMNGLNGAMAGISFTGDAALRRTNSPARSCPQSYHSDLTDFISDEIKRRNDSVALPSTSRKRHNSLHDVKPSSPKRRK